MDFQHRAGGKTGSGGAASWSESNRDRRERLKALALETIDVTQPGRPLTAGRLHPLTQTADQVKTVLSGMGYQFVDGPELEDYAYNFAALNEQFENLRKRLCLEIEYAVEAEGRD